MSGLQREVIKWIQSLDLTWQIKTPKWDLTNGYLIAEVFSWYFPEEIQMHMFNNGTSLDSKQRNWLLLKNFIKHHNIEIPEQYVEGTIHCKEGAAQLLIHRIYEILTNRVQNKGNSTAETEFTDTAYQSKLPMHARSTASQAVKNNLRITELMADKNLILGQQKAQAILNQHLDHRRKEREEDPRRFNKKPTLGELAVRRPLPSQSQEGDVANSSAHSVVRVRAPKQSPQGMDQQSHRAEFHEIQVKQLDRNSQQQSISGF